MFNYSIKTKVILIAALLSIIIVVIIAVNFNYSRSQDLQLVTQAKILANGLEEYYNKFNSYPESSRIAVNQINVISDSGLNQSGERIYFQRNFKWARSAYYSSDGYGYTIEFDLNNSWDVWNLQGDGKCQITANMIMECLNN